MGDSNGSIYYTSSIHSIWHTQNSGVFTMSDEFSIDIDKALENAKTTDLNGFVKDEYPCLLYTSPSPRDRTRSRMPSSA